MNQGDLLGVLKDSRPSMPLTRQLTYAFQVADGMNYLAEELNCVHRDLAARNILVRQDENGEMHAKIADFGLSRHLYSDMYKHQGTKPRPLPAKWMALESLMYFIFTTKSDVWSYGVLIWEIMTLGRTPYPGVENRELLEQIEEKGLKLSKPKTCPKVLFEMILDCTQHETDERPTFNQLRAQMSEYLKMAEEGRLKAEEEEEVEGGRLVTTDEGEEGERGAVKGKEEVERVVKREEEAGRESVASESEGVRGEGDGAGNVLRPNGVVKPPLASPPTSPAHQPHPSPKRTNGTASITAPSRPPRRGGSPSCTAYQLSGGDAGKAEKPQVLDIEQGSPRKSLTEVTPQGHLYYLLDPFVDSEHSRDHAPQLAAPHQPNHAPTTSKLGRPASPGSVQPRTGADLNSVGVSSAP